MQVSCIRLYYYFNCIAQSLHESDIIIISVLQQNMCPSREKVRKRNRTLVADTSSREKLIDIARRPYIPLFIISDTGGNVHATTVVPTSKSEFVPKRAVCKYHLDRMECILHFYDTSTSTRV